MSVITKRRVTRSKPENSMLGTWPNKREEYGGSESVHNPSSLTAENLFYPTKGGGMSDQQEICQLQKILHK
jgi:hypothetical protein